MMRFNSTIYKEPSTQGEQIDFVITWVDGNDPNWLFERKSYSKEIIDGVSDIRDERFRDWAFLRYWFRGVERFAPWVRQVHFITWGHIPSWLNTGHPKLNVVKHSDYIPKKYLPTFNSNVLDLNCFRIKGLSERFVLFNDDTFLVNDISKDVFFKNGMPRSTAVLTPQRTIKGSMFYTPFTNMSILNEYFHPWNCISSQPLKWFNAKYGLDVFRTLLMLPYPRFYGFKEYHLPNAFLKSSFEQVWEKEGDELERTCQNRFRGPIDVSQWLIREWQVASGAFEPLPTNVGKNVELGKNFDTELIVAYKEIIQRKRPLLCISDGSLCETDFEIAKEILKEAFECILPHKSEYEL